MSYLIESTTNLTVNVIVKISVWITLMVLVWMFGYTVEVTREGMIASWIVALAGTMALATSKSCLAVDVVPVYRRPPYGWRPARTRTYYRLSLTVGAGAG